MPTTVMTTMAKKTVLTSGFALLGLVALATLSGMLAPCDDCCSPGEANSCFDCCCAKVIGVAVSGSPEEEFFAVYDGLASLPQHVAMTDVIHGLDHPPRA